MAKSALMYRYIDVHLSECLLKDPPEREADDAVVTSSTRVLPEQMSRATLSILLAKGIPEAVSNAPKRRCRRGFNATLHAHTLMLFF